MLMWAREQWQLTCRLATLLTIHATFPIWAGTLQRDAHSWSAKQAEQRCRGL